MAKDLTNSKVDRQNILNNQYALQAIENEVKLSGIMFEGKMIFFKDQVADFFEVTSRTIDKYLLDYADEITQNGYEVLSGKRLQSLKVLLKSIDVNEINFVNINTPQIGIFDNGTLLPGKNRAFLPPYHKETLRR